MTDITENVELSTYTVGEETYTVGDVIELPEDLQNLITEYKTAGDSAEGSLSGLYRNLLFGTSPTFDTTAGEEYFLVYQANEGTRQDLMGQINRAMYKHFGGFVPTQLNFAEGTATVRELQPGETTALDDEQIRAELNITQVGQHLVDLLKGVGATHLDFNYKEWSAAGSMVLEGQQAEELEIAACPSTQEELEALPLYQQIFSTFKDLTPSRMLPYMLLATGGTTTRVAGFAPNPNLSSEVVGGAFGALLAPMDATKPTLSVNLFTDVEQSEDAAPMLIFNVMMVFVTPEEATMINARFNVTDDGLVFREIWDNEAIKAKQQADAEVMSA
jgi:hypothetical protein